MSGFTIKVCRIKKQRSALIRSLRKFKFTLEERTTKDVPCWQLKKPEFDTHSLYTYSETTSHHAPPTLLISPYLRATASSLDKVNRSLLLLGNMAAKMRVNRPEEGEETPSDHRPQHHNHWQLKIRTDLSVWPLSTCLLAWYENLWTSEIRRRTLLVALVTKSDRAFTIRAPVELG